MGVNSWKHFSINVLVAEVHCFSSLTICSIEDFMKRQLGFSFLSVTWFSIVLDSRNEGL